jgi:PAS domain S-box-containing protein
MHAQGQVVTAAREGLAGPSPVELLEAVLDTIADGVIVYDLEGRTVRSSPAADGILGIPVEERQVPVGERVMRQYEILTEDGRPQGREEMVAVRAAVHGETVPGALYSVRSGDAPPRWLNISGKPLFVNGRHAGGVISMTDMTERKRAEMELTVITRLYAVLSLVNEAIVRIRDEGSLCREVCRIVSEEGGFPLVWVGMVTERQVAVAASWGPATGYLGDVQVEVRGELGQGPTGTCIRENRPVVNDDFATNPATWPWRDATRAHGLRASAAFPLHRRGAAIGAITFYAGRPGFFTARQVALIEALCADVSFALDAMEQERLRSAAELELRQANESLRDADRRKDEFLGMLSHELRNPLAPIRNSIHLLRHATPDREQTNQALGIIERQAGHMARIVDDLLDVTRIAHGKIELRRSRIDLREIVDRAGEDFRGLWPDHAVRFEVVLPEGKLWADADPTRITQVIGNLLHNAAKFTRQGDRVTLSLAAADGRAEIRVRDTGSGIDPELLPRIFDPFVQGQRSLARTKGGLGLGLALVQGITRLHGGTVHAGSPGLGQGAEFTVRLPLAVPAADPRQGAAGDGPPEGSLRVLVVDDNKDAAWTLGLLLRLAGHTVDVAHDGPSALALARGNPPDAVLCDLGLPGMDGFEVARTLRAEGPKGLRLIAVSGYALPEDIQRALAAGFDSHMAKPPNPEEIMRRLGSGRNGGT